MTPQEDFAMNDLQQRIAEAVAKPKNLGEMSDADAVGTAGSEGCGDMLRMWVKFRQDAMGRKVIDRATFQTFGCETAIAVASVATELVAGKTVAEALDLSGARLRIEADRHRLHVREERIAQVAHHKLAYRCGEPRLCQPDPAVDDWDDHH